MPKTQTPSDNTKKAQEQVETIFLSYDPKEAYSRFAQLYSSSNNQNVTHNTAHWVGEFLYKNHGIEGVSICDDQFNYGCYHGFYGRAFSQEGPDLVVIAQTACEQNSTIASIGGCIHGIGHGILAYFGYSQTELIYALELCDTLEGQSGQEGCYNGVFMEYNTRLMQAEQAIIRELEVGGELSPCLALSKPSHRLACLYEQPSWWASSKLPLGRYYELCSALKDPQDFKRCISGVFRMAPVLSSFKVEETKEYCSTIPKNEKHLCTIKTGEVLLSNKALNAISICDIMDEVSSRKCREYLDKYSCEVLGLCTK